MRDGRDQCLNHYLTAKVSCMRGRSVFVYLETSFHFPESGYFPAFQCIRHRVSIYRRTEGHLGQLIS